MSGYAHEDWLLCNKMTPCQQQGNFKQGICIGYRALKCAGSAKAGYTGGTIKALSQAL